jgi:tetratricopeptide (TPR) repeat protein
MRLKGFICLLLAGVTLAIYWPASDFTFIYRDDQFFILSPEVATGLSPEGLNWAMTAVVAANWHPITTFSFLLMHEFFGLDPGAEHLVNIVFHAANAVLLFLVLMEMTGGRAQSPQSSVCSPEAKGRIWCCAIVAAIFAWHPLHVESVAWIAERKDVLFTFFMLLSMWCYVGYAQGKKNPSELSSVKQVKSAPRASAGESSPSSAFALLRRDKPRPSPPGEGESSSEAPRTTDQGARPNFKSKGEIDSKDSPSPLPSPAGRGRLNRPTNGPKPEFLSRNGYYNLALGFFILSLLCKAMVVTLPFLLLLLDYWPLGRLKRTTIRSLIFEKWRFFGLMIFFCGLTFWLQKRTGAIASLNHIGITARLENSVLNYGTYLGEFFWPVNLAIPYPFPESFDVGQVVLTALLLLAISALCIVQIRRRPYLAMGWFWYLGTMLPVIGLVQLGAQGMADRYAYITLIGPSISLVWLVWQPAFAKASARQGAGARLFWKYLTVSAAVVILAAWGLAAERQLQFWKDTVTLFSHSTAVTPENGVAEYTLALGLQHEGRLREAAVHYRITTAVPPDNDHFMANIYFAELLANEGYYSEAEKRVEAALKINANSPLALNNLAWTLATCPDAKARDGARAVGAAEQACELTHYQNPTYLTTLGAAYAEAGRFEDATNMAQKAIALANQDGLDSVAEGNEELLQAYSEHKTYAQTHEASQQTVQGQ